MERSGLELGQDAGALGGHLDDLGNARPRAGGNPLQLRR